MDTPAQGSKHIRYRHWILASLLVFSLVALPFHGRIQQFFLEQTALVGEAPASDVVVEAIRGAANPSEAILTAWNSGHVVPRTIAMQELNQLLPKWKTLPPLLEPLVLAAAVDPDFSVREMAIGALDQLHHPLLVHALAGLLQDPDPELRLIALRRSRNLTTNEGISLVTTQLGSKDPRVVGYALKLLGNWTGQDFGVRLADTVSTANEANEAPEFRPASRELALAGARRARSWLATHSSEWTPLTIEPLTLPNGSAPLSEISNTVLVDLDQKPLRLSKLRGKIVVINFWTTWCAACVGEIPALNSLQERHPDDLAVLGVSLDGVPDQHGHSAGHSHDELDDEHGVETTLTNQEIQKEVRKVAQKRGIHYRIFLDPENKVGGRFNGGELPTTLLIDGNGHIRRRFVGAREPAVFEDMIQELLRK